MGPVDIGVHITSTMMQSLYDYATSTFSSFWPIVVPVVAILLFSFLASTIMGFIRRWRGDV